MNMLKPLALGRATKALVLALLGLNAALPAHADEYPARPSRSWFPSPPAEATTFLPAR